MATSATDETGTDDLEGQKKRATMSLASHLVELRRRIIISILAVIVGAFVAFAFYTPLLHFLQAPYCRAIENLPDSAFSGKKAGCHFYISQPLDGFKLRFSIAGWGGLILALPVILWEIWRFVTPGLKGRERRYAVSFIIASMTLFLVGATVAYFFFERALIFLFHIGGQSLTPLLNPNSYFSLLMTMMLLFGLSFEFPVILVALELAGVVTPRQLLKVWRYAVITIVVVAALFTPSGDPVTMLAMAVPLTVFYFIAIGIGKLFGK